MLFTTIRTKHGAGRAGSRRPGALFFAGFALVLAAAAALTLAACSSPDAAGVPRPLERGADSFAVSGGPRLLGGRLVLNYGDHSFELDPRDLSCVLVQRDGSGSRVISVGTLPDAEPGDAPGSGGPRCTIDGTLALITYPNLDLAVRVDYRTDRFSLEFVSGRPQTVAWPLAPVAVDEALLLPTGEGQRVPAGDEVWREFLCDYPRKFSEFFWMPFWAIEDEARIVTFLLDNPFHNTFSCSEGTAGSIAARVEHGFSDNYDVDRPYTVTVFVDREGDLLAPARRFRADFIESGSFVSFAEKTAAVPLNERLVGATHFVPSGGDLFTASDIRGGEASHLARRIIVEAEAASGSVGGRVVSAIDGEEER